MTDAAHLMRQDSAEKKRIGRGSRNRVGHTRRCTLPSDYMTTKQIKEMNGPVSTYNLSQPMSWAELKNMPEDLQRQYLDGLAESYGVTDSALADMLGVSYCTVYKLSKSLNRKPNARMTAEQKNVWEAFLGHGQDPDAPGDEEPEIQVTESVRKYPPRERVPAVEFDAGTLTLNGVKGAVLQRLFEVLPEHVSLTVEFSRISVKMEED